MNKRLLALASFFVALLILAAWFFFMNGRGDDLEIASEPFSFPLSAENEPSEQSAPEIPQETSQESVPEIISGCNEGSAFEQDRCISEIAVEESDENFCSYVQGSLARSACIRSVKEPAGSVTQVAPSSAYETILRSYASNPQPQASSPLNVPVKSVRAFDEIVASGPASADTSVEAFFSRTAEETQVSLYAVFPYQNKVGDSVKIQGSGFALDPVNTVYIGGQSVSGLSSPDGMTLAFSMPSVSEGKHEVWVENERGSSRVSARPIYAVVSSNPVPPPVLTGVTPKNPSADDTITISGNNLSGIQGVFTSLGKVNGNSLSFKISDLEYAYIVTDNPDIQGMKAQMAVYVLAEGGMNEQPLLFEVQF